METLKDAPVEVKVYSSLMGEKVISTTACTWGQLQKQLDKDGVSYNGMKAVIGETKMTMESSASQLPDTGFTLFLMPVKTKSGAKPGDGLSYKELRGAIQSRISNDSSAASHFNVGKNYITKGTEELRTLLNSYKPKGGAKTAPAPVAKVTPVAKPTAKATTKPSVKPVATKVPVTKVVDVSGLSYSELRAKIKDILAVDDTTAKAHFNVTKNYTTKGTEELRSLLGLWLNGTRVSATKAAPVQETTKPKATPKAAEVKTVASKDVTGPKVKSLKERYEELRNVIPGVK